MHFVIECVQIKLLKELTQNKKVVISLAVDKSYKMSDLLKILTTYLFPDIEILDSKQSDRGEMLNSASNFRFSEINHQLYLCRSADVIESIYQDSEALEKLKEKNKLVF